MTDQSTPCAELWIQVHPRSHRSGLAFVGDVLHAWVTAPPMEGAANAAVIALLAQAAGVPRRQVNLVRGATMRHKKFRIAGLTRDDLRRTIGTSEETPS
jgi:uncharacterized protein YggU (UPF0235/DUF167 family)